MKVMTIPPKSTILTITSHLNLLNTKKTMTYDIGNPGSCLGQEQTYGLICVTLPIKHI